MLHHYTSVSLACSIFSTDLRYGHYNTQRHGIIQPVVWLTTSLNEKEHGLLTGLDAEGLATLLTAELGRCGQDEGWHPLTH